MKVKGVKETFLIPRLIHSERKLEQIHRSWIISMLMIKNVPEIGRKMYKCLSQQARIGQLISDSITIDNAQP